jgi:hypothetical protein
LIGIFTSQAMRERGRYQIQFMKTRSSSGVGSKVDLEFDRDGLRISDLDDDATDGGADDAVVSSIYDKLKKKSELSPGKNVAENAVVERAVDNTDKLRSILKKQD